MLSHNYCSAFLCTRVQKPDSDDYKKLGRVIKYLRKTMNLPLRLEADSLNIGKWWVDASYAFNPDMKSHTGGVGNPTDAFRSVGFIHCILLRFKLSPWASYFLSWALFLTLSVVVLYTTTLYIDNSRQQDLTPMTTSWRHSHEFIMPRDHNYDFPSF